MKIFINPGHMPGVDSGAVNPVSGLRECDVAKKVGELVEYYLQSAGCSTMLLQSNNLCRYQIKTKQMNFRNVFTCKKTNHNC